MSERAEYLAAVQQVIDQLDTRPEWRSGAVLAYNAIANTPRLANPIDDPLTSELCRFRDFPFHTHAYDLAAAIRAAIREEIGHVEKGVGASAPKRVYSVLEEISTDGAAPRWFVIEWPMWPDRMGVPMIVGVHDLKMHAVDSARWRASQCR